MNLPRSAKLRWLNGSVLCLILTVIPLTILGVYPLLNTSDIDMSYDVPRTHRTFADLFAQSTVLKTDPIALWLVIAAMICAFITTVDTWLIGIMQHLASTVRVRRDDIVIISPYAMVLIGAIGATMLSGKLFLAVGLYLFPYLFFNTLFFLCEVFPSLKRFTGPWQLMGCLFIGFLITTGMIATNWSDQELVKVPDSVILFSALGIYTVFFIMAFTARMTSAVGGASR